jgi:acyl-CoA thioesterase II
VTSEVDDLLACLRLREVTESKVTVGEASTGEVTAGEATTSEFTGVSTRRPEHRIYGGQLLAQSVVAGSRTVPTDAVPHSVHSCFVNPGRPEEPIRYVVTPLRDGRSFHTRRIDALQLGGLVCSVTVSFQRPEEGVHHQDHAPEVPGPDGLPSRSLFRHSPDAEGTVDVRVCPPEENADEAGWTVWLRVAARLPDDPALHRALLVYLSDFSILHGAYRRQGLRQTEIRTASLDHSVWLHGAGRADEWLLYRSRSPAAGNGRAIGFGTLFDAQGRLLATSAQEMLLRIPRT